ncbi:MAG: lysozyme inhibitor LprI family protein [Caulobacterales bacterium]
MRIVTMATVAALGAAGILTASIAVGPHAARAASFNCNQAAAPSEFAICGDPQLSSLDSAIGVAYAQRLAQEPALRQVQRAWLKARDVGCGHDRACLKRFITAQLGWLRSVAETPTALPTLEGSCALTTISNVGTRLDGMPGSGSAVNMANGADQVSYDTIAAIDRSRPGDPVLVCLVSLPRNCPAGDDRGKIYAAANLRTLGAWSDADSEHMCGGA